MAFDFLKNMDTLNQILDGGAKEVGAIMADLKKDATPEMIEKLNPELKRMQEAIKEAHEQSQKVHYQASKRQGK